MKIRIDSKKGLPVWCKVLLLICLIVDFNSDWRSVKVPLVSVSLLTTTQILFIGMAILHCLLKRKNRVSSPYFKWCAIFILYSFISMFWSIEPQLIPPQIKSLVILYGFISALSYMVRDKQSIIDVFKIVVVSIVITGVYILGFVDISTLDGERIGAGVSGLEAWNANDIGLKMSTGVSISLFLLEYEIKKRTKYLLIAIFTMIIGFLTGSRKAILMIVIVMFLYMYVKSKNAKKLQVILRTCFVVVCGYVIVMNFEPLYEIAGVRFENLIQGMFGGETSETSFNERNMMILYGSQWFLKHPVLGYGLSQYRVLLRSVVGIESYSHNNYIEMLVNGGILGFVIHYAMYIYILINIWKKAIKERELLAVLLFALIIVFLVMEWALVSYTDTVINLCLMLSCMYCMLEKNFNRMISNENIVC